MKRVGRADPNSYTDHSLRAGLATAAAGVEERRITVQTRHRSAGMVRRYIRETELWRHNIATELGL